MKKSHSSLFLADPVYFRIFISLRPNRLDKPIHHNKKNLTMSNIILLVFRMIVLNFAHFDVLQTEQSVFFRDTYTSKHAKQARMIVIIVQKFRYSKGEVSIRFCCDKFMGAYHKRNITTQDKTVKTPNEYFNLLTRYMTNCVLASDVEAEAEAGSGSAGSGYFLWKRKRKRKR